jgi:hemerythrin-like metal-binding protein
MRSPTLQITWSDSMSVGIPEIDEDHKQFIVLINELNRSITDRMSPEEIIKRLEFLIDDTARHFDQEERLFFEWQYPDISGHAGIHANVLKTLNVMKQQFMPYGHDSGWVDAGIKIKKILIDHILKEDMKYADFYHNHRGTVVKNEKADV